MDRYEEAVRNHPEIFGDTRMIYSYSYWSLCLIGARGETIKVAPHGENEDTIRDRIERSIVSGKNLFLTEWMKPPKLRDDVIY